MDSTNPVSLRQQYLKVNSQMIGEWTKMYGQEVAVYRFISNPVNNNELARLVYGADRVASNISKLSFVKNIKIPVAFDDLVAAHADKSISLEVCLTSDELKVNDVLMLDYLGQKLEFVVQEDLGLHLQSLYKYTIKTRASQDDLRG